MSKTVIPDNLHFYKKNENNVLSVNLPKDITLSLNYSKSIGESEVGINLLGLPRSETRGVIHEDVSTYGLNIGNWVTNVFPDYSPYGYANDYHQRKDPNADGTSLGAPRAIKRNREEERPNIQILKGVFAGWDPDAVDVYCPECNTTQRQKYGYVDKTFLPFIYHDKENSSISMEGWTAKSGYDLDYSPQKCSPCPGRFTKPSNYLLKNYKCELETRETYRYEPGKVIGFTFGLLTSTENTLGFNHIKNIPEHKKAKWGVRNGTDAYYFLLEGKELKLVRESSFPGNNVVLEKRDFLDKLDGTGPSKAIIDFSKLTMYSVEFSWYGAIGATFFAYLPTQNNKTRWIKIAEIPSSNIYPNPSLSDPYMKMFLELEIPWGVERPQFLKKFGTSVYMDGLGFGKANFSKTKSFTTQVKELDYDFDRNIFTIEIPEKTNTGVAKFSRSKFKPISLEGYFDSNTILTVERVLDNKRKHFSMPIMTLGLSGLDNLSKLFYDGTGLPLYTWSYTEQNSPGRAQEYSDSLYDYVLPLNASPLIDTNYIEVQVPNNYDINDVIRTLLNNIPGVFVPQNLHRNVFDNLLGLGFDYFNHVKGVELAGIVERISNMGNRVLRLHIRGKVSSKDGRLNSTITNFTHLKDDFLTSIGGVNNYPNYGANHCGPLRYFEKTFGGVHDKTVPAYDTSCKVVVNKSYYRNNSCYIVNSKIDKGYIYFQPPVGLYSCGLITETTLDQLNQLNFFKGYNFSSLGDYTFSGHNIQGFIESKSIFYDKQYYNKSLYIDAQFIFKSDQTYSGTYYDKWGNLRPEWGNKASTYKIEKDIGMPVSQDANALLFTNSWSKYQSYSYSEGQGTFGYEINIYECRISARLNKRIYSAYNNNWYEIGFDDVTYLKNGTYTNSKEFWLMFLNNLNQININGEFKVTGVNFGGTGSVSLMRDNNAQNQAGTDIFKHKAILVFNNSGYNQGARVDIKMRTINYMGITNAIPPKYYVLNTYGDTINPLKDLFNNDVSLFTTTVIPITANLYFFCTTNVDLDAKPPLLYYGYYAGDQNVKSNVWGDINIRYTTNSQNGTSVSPESANNLNYKFCFTKFKVTDKNGVASNNLCPLFIQDYKIEENIWVARKSNDNVIKKSPIVLNGVSFSQNQINDKYTSAKLFLEDNDYSQIIDSNLIKTYNYIFLKNKKQKIDLSIIFKDDGEKILPTSKSSYIPFNSFFTVKAKSLNSNLNEKNTGIVTFNYEEQI